MERASPGPTLKSLSGDDGFVGESEVRHSQHSTQTEPLELRGTFYPDSLILVPWSVNGEATCTAELGHVHDTYSHQKGFWPNVIAAATYNTRTHPHARHASVSCLAWTSDDPKRLQGPPILSGLPLQFQKLLRCRCGQLRWATKSGFAPGRSTLQNCKARGAQPRGTRAHIGTMNGIHSGTVTGMWSSSLEDMYLLRPYDEWQGTAFETK